MKSKNQSVNETHELQFKGHESLHGNGLQAVKLQVIRISCSSSVRLSTWENEAKSVLNNILIELFGISGKQFGYFLIVYHSMKICL